LIFPEEFNNFSQSLKVLVARMLNRNIEKRPNSGDCLRDTWFSEFFPNKLIMTTNGSKIISQIENKGRKAKKLKSALTLEVNMDSFFEANTGREPLKALHAGIHQINAHLHHTNTK